MEWLVSIGLYARSGDLEPCKLSVHQLQFGINDFANRFPKYTSHDYGILERGWHEYRSLEKRVVAWQLGQACSLPHNQCVGATQALVERVRNIVNNMPSPVLYAKRKGHTKA